MRGTACASRTPYIVLSSSSSDIHQPSTTFVLVRVLALVGPDKSRKSVQKRSVLDQFPGYGTYGNLWKVLRKAIASRGAVAIRPNSTQFESVRLHFCL
jgi:hypothetical protein